MIRQNYRETLGAMVLVASLFCLIQGGAAQDATKLVQDPQIEAALRQVSAQGIEENIKKLVRFGTRLTLSAQDPESIAKGHGIGAARDWISA